jgi:hypothetical protein
MTNDVLGHLGADRRGKITLSFDTNGASTVRITQVSCY